MHVIIYSMKGNKRNQACTDALKGGIAQSGGGDHVLILDQATYTKPLQTDVVCFYGLSGNLMRIFQDYRHIGTPTVFIDLGVWGRKGDPEPDFHRVAVNAYQPTAYFTFDATSERFLSFKKEIQPWRYTGEEILIAGMSERAAQVWGLGSAVDHAQWLIAEVRKYTDRPIAYRPKPSCPMAQSIPGTRYANHPHLEEELNKAWCVVTYRSHVAVNALISGVPVFVLGDHPALLMSHLGTRQESIWGITTLIPNDLSKIETPYYPDDPKRLQFCSMLAWHQFSLREFRSGYMWKTIKKHGYLETKKFQKEAR